jgi:hypothetical protein
MPFKSAKQRRFLFAKHPDIANRWAAEYGTEIAKKKKRARGRKAPSPSDRMK